MTDRNTISQVIESLFEDWIDKNINVHPLAVENMRILEADALELLKEQEAKWIHREDMDFIDKYNCTHFHGMCTNCGLVHDFIDGHTGQYLYCPQCGRAVKWE